MQIEAIKIKIENAGKVIQNRYRTIEDVISAGVDMVNVVADLEEMIARKYADISLRPGVENYSEAKIKRLWHNETIDERKLLTIAKGFKKTLKNIEYNLLK
ncbi:MAG: hypothetical protein NC918_02620 [Candidatus Omnitrophica bacterium]|nr:hypothetical protein [Candidatus Omnitrophota bacterium]